MIVVRCVPAPSPAQDLTSSGDGSARDISAMLFIEGFWHCRSGGCPSGCCLAALPAWQISGAIVGSFAHGFDQVMLGFCPLDMLQMMRCHD